MTKVSDSDKNLLKRSSGAVATATVEHIDNLLKSAPLLGLAYNLAKGLMGNTMEMRIKRVVEFMEPIVNDPSTYTQKVLKSEDFQDGFAATLQTYLTIRTDKKREIVRGIFKDFAKNHDKQNFQLERFTDTVLKISPASIALLGFIYKEAIPLKKKMITEKLKIDNLGTEKPYDWWFDLNMKREPISKYVDQWVFNNYSPGSEQIKAKYGVKPQDNLPDKKQFELMEIETAKREELSKPVAELIYLGLATTVSAGVVFGSGGGITWTLSDFAYEFIKYLND